MLNDQLLIDTIKEMQGGGFVMLKAVRNKLGINNDVHFRNAIKKIVGESPLKVRVISKSNCGTSGFDGITHIRIS